jgi:hypothetical protein
LLRITKTLETNLTTN